MREVTRVILVKSEAFTSLTSLKRENFTGRIDFQIAKFWKFVLLRNIHAMYLVWKTEGIKAVAIKVIPCF